MKLILKEQPEISETEVEIRYAKLDAEVQNLAKRIEQQERYLYGSDNGRQYRILLADIFYAESVDRKTFIYTQSDVFRCELKLYQLLDKIDSPDFLQVSKSCILNLQVLEHIQTLFNSKLEGTLTNGEKITITRTYIPKIRAAFSQKERV